MPNHVTNVLTLRGDAARVREVLEAVRQDGFGLGSVDFNKILPMPERLNIEASSKTDAGLQAYKDFIEVYTLGGTLHQDELSEIPHENEAAFLRQRTDIRPEVWALGKTAWNNLRLYGAATWYDWRVRHWGTKWNAYGCEDGRFREENRLAFQTAWSAPHPVLEKLAVLFPKVELEHEWADEDIGRNCGRYRYQNGERVEEWFPETEREAVVFACSVMGAAPEEWGLALSAAGIGYKTPWIAKKTIEGSKIPILPYTRYTGKKDRYKPWEYTYDPANDTYICPRGGILRHTTTDREGKRTYRSTPAQCRDCPCKAKCGANEKGQKVYTTHIWQEYLDLVEQIRKTDRAKEIYAQRKETIERVFADAKEKHAMRYTHHRGLAAVTRWVRLKFAAMNPKKLANWSWKNSFSRFIFVYCFPNCKKSPAFVT